MKYWLVKQEPEDYSFETLVKDRHTTWTGVRNFQARNFLRGMERGDQVLFYHSGKAKSVVGLARVRREAFPDPTADEEGWVAVEIEPVKALSESVPLATIKADPALKQLLLVRQSRLSVMPVEPKEFKRILELAKTRV